MKIITHLILLGHLNGKETVSISSKYHSKLLTTNYNSYKKDCLYSTVNFKLRFSLEQKRCNSYELKNNIKDGAITIYSPLVSKSFTNKWKRMELEGYRKGYEADQIFEDRRVEIQNRFLIRIRNVFNYDGCSILLNELYDSRRISNDTLQKNKYFFKGFEKGRFYTKASDKNGRLYNILTFTKKECRRLLDKKYVEVDITNSSPFFLSHILTFLMYSDVRALNRKTNFIGVLKNQLVNYLRKEELERKEISEESLISEDWLNPKTIEKLSNVELMNLMLENLRIDEKQRIVNPLLRSSNILLSLFIISYLYSILSSFNKLNDIKLLNLSVDKFFLSNNPTSNISSFFSNISNFTNHNNILYNTFHFCILEFEQNLKNLNVRAEKGCFYDSLSKSKRSPFGNWLHLLDEDEIPFEIRRKVIKKSFMFWMNGKGNKEGVFFRKEYPTINNLFNHIKKVFGKTSLHSLTTIVESNFVFGVIDKANQRSKSSKPFIVGSLHDAFFVEKKKLNNLLKIIETQSKTMLGGNIPIKTKQLKEEYL